MVLPPITIIDDGANGSSPFNPHLPFVANDDQPTWKLCMCTLSGNYQYHQMSGVVPVPTPQSVANHIATEHKRRQDEAQQKIFDTIYTYCCPDDEPAVAIALRPEPAATIALGPMLAAVSTPTKQSHAVPRLAQSWHPRSPRIKPFHMGGRGTHRVYNIFSKTARRDFGRSWRGT